MSERRMVVTKRLARIPLTDEQWAILSAEANAGVATALAFEQAMGSVEASIEATAAEMLRLRRDALRLSRETPLSAVQAIHQIAHKRFPDYPFRSAQRSHLP